MDFDYGSATKANKQAFNTLGQVYACFLGGLEDIEIPYMIDKALGPLVPPGLDVCARDLGAIEVHCKAVVECPASIRQ